MQNHMTMTNSDNINKTLLYTAHLRQPGWSLLIGPVDKAERPKGHRTGSERMKLMHAVLSIMFIAAALFGQSQTFHLSGGFSGSDVREAGDEQWVGRSGYQFGADVLIGNRLFVKPGVHYVVRNMRYTLLDDATLSEQEFEYTSQHVSIPVLVGANLIDPLEGGKFNAYLMAGPTALIAMRTDLNNSTLSVDTRGTQWYLGGGGGLGYGPVFLEGGYHLAMSNVFKGEGFSTNPKVNYTYIIVGVRLRFPGQN